MVTPNTVTHAHRAFVGRMTTPGRPHVGVGRAVARVGVRAAHVAIGAPHRSARVRDDVVGELGVGGHTVVRGWVWPGSQRLANQRQGGVARVCQSSNTRLGLARAATFLIHPYCGLNR